MNDPEKQDRGAAGDDARDEPRTGGRSSERAPPASGNPLAPGSLFDHRYEIIALIGEGGMGQVYKALDRELNKIIALKTIRPDRGDDPQLLQRFKQELVLARMITHKNVVRIYDLGEAEGIRYFTMEYIDGVSLKEAVRSRGRIPVPEALSVARQILSALEEAREQGVIHRDLKPQNIMIDRSGSPHVMDFGVARASGESGLTRTGAIIGTPDYMAPEQAQGERADASTDLFAVGVMLYEMLTGELPYGGETTLSRVMMRLTHRPRPPRELHSDIPRYLEKVVLKCLESDRALRYRSAGEVLEDLDRRLVDRSPGRRIRRALGRRRRTLAFAAVSAAAALGTVAVLDREGGAPDLARESDDAEILAIVPLTNAAGATELEWLRRGIPEMLFTDLSQSTYIRPVPAERVFKVLQELGIAENRRFDDSELESISKKTRAESILYGQFVQSGDNLRLDLVLRKAGSGVPIPFSIERRSADVFGLVDEITLRVKREMDLSPEQLKADADRPVAEVSTANRDALQAYQNGLAELRRGASQEAIPFLKRAVEKDPGFAMAFSRLAEAHMNRGERDAAQAAIEEALALAERRSLPLAERHYVHAVAARLRGDLETMARTYQELSNLYPEDPDVSFHLAQSLEELGRVPEAMEAYRKVLELEPSYGSALLGLARIQVMADQNREAIETIETALEADRFRGEADALGMAHSILGVASRELGDWDRAFEHFQASLAYRRRSGDQRGEAVTLWNLASLHKSRGEIDEALELQRAALDIARAAGDREQESNALHEMGLTYMNAGDLDEALACFEKSMLIETERQDAASLATSLNLIAEIYRRQRRYADALVYLENARSYLARTEERRETAVNLHVTGMVRMEQGHFKEAFTALLEALSTYREIGQRQGIAETQQSLAEIYLRQGRYGDAYESLQESTVMMEELRLDHVAEAKALLGRLWVALARPDRAAAAYREAEQHGHAAHGEGLMAEILLGRAELARLSGRTREAAEGYRNAEAVAEKQGKLDLSLECRLARARLHLERGETATAEKLLASLRSAPEPSPSRALQSEVQLLLARLQFETGELAGAEASVREAIRLAEIFSGHPVLYRAQALLGEVLLSQGRGAAARDAYAKAAESLEWIRGGLRPEQVDWFMSRPDVRELMDTAAEVIERGEKTDGASPSERPPAAGRRTERP